MHWHVPSNTAEHQLASCHRSNHSMWQHAEIYPKTQKHLHFRYRQKSEANSYPMAKVRRRIHVPKNIIQLILQNCSAKRDY